MKLQDFKNKEGSKYLSIEFVEQKGWYYANWMGNVSAAEVEEGCTRFLEFIQKNPCPYGLNDNRMLRGGWATANEWIAQEWAPKVADLGLKYMAHIMSPDPMTKLSAADLGTRINTLEFRVFSTIQEAEKWLRYCQENEAISVG